MVPFASQNSPNQRTPLLLLCEIWLKQTPFHPRSRVYGRLRHLVHLIEAYLCGGWRNCVQLLLQWWAMFEWKSRRCWCRYVVDVVHGKQRWIEWLNELTRTFRDGMNQKDAWTKKKKEVSGCIISRWIIYAGELAEEWPLRTYFQADLRKGKNGLTDNKHPKPSLECIYHWEQGPIVRCLQIQKLVWLVEVTLRLKHTAVNFKRWFFCCC